MPVDSRYPLTTLRQRIGSEPTTPGRSNSHVAKAPVPVPTNLWEPSGQLPEPRVPPSKAARSLAHTPLRLIVQGLVCASVAAVCFQPRDLTRHWFARISAGAYTAPRSPLTRRKAPPAYSFPGSARSHVDRRDVPGPGHYDEVRPVGWRDVRACVQPAIPVVASHAVVRTQKGNGFTIRGRYKVSTKQWEREGPGRCREKSMFGKQVDSLKRSHGGFTMGSRFRSRAADTTPGVCATAVCGSVVGLLPW